MMDISKMLNIDESDEPLMNKAIEDSLAMSGLDAESRIMTLSAWLQLGAEYLAREAGRSRAVEIVKNTERFLLDADPVRPWKK